MRVKEQAAATLTESERPVPGKGGHKLSAVRVNRRRCRRGRGVEAISRGGRGAPQVVGERAGIAVGPGTLPHRRAR